MQEAVLGEAVSKAGKILPLLLLPGQHQSLGWFVLRGRGKGLAQEATFTRGIMEWFWVKGL